MKNKIIVITGTSGFIGYEFLKFALNEKYKVIDILRHKNRKNRKLNSLRRQNKKNYKSIFFSKYNELEKKLKKIKVDYFVNFATLYINNHHFRNINNLVESNILFPTIIYDLVCFKAKKIINFGTMMQHENSIKFNSKNLYAATKNSFEMISNYYLKLNNNTKFYNLNFYESYGLNDGRKKLIPTLIKNYKKDRTTIIFSKNLELNILHISDLIKAIEVIIKSNIKSGSYCLKQKKNTKIKKLINNINKNLKRKLKIKYLNNNASKIIKNKLKILPDWKPTINIDETIKQNFLNENY